MGYVHHTCCSLYCNLVYIYIHIFIFTCTIHIYICIYNTASIQSVVIDSKSSKYFSQLQTLRHPFIAAMVMHLDMFGQCHRHLQHLCRLLIRHLIELAVTAARDHLQGILKPQKVGSTQWWWNGPGWAMDIWDPRNNHDPLIGWKTKQVHYPTTDVLNLIFSPRNEKEIIFHSSIFRVPCWFSWGAFWQDLILIQVFEVSVLRVFGAVISSTDSLAQHCDVRNTCILSGSNYSTPISLYIYIIYGSFQK